MFSLKVASVVAVLILTVNLSQCSNSATIKSLHQDGDCDSSVLNLGTLEVVSTAKTEPAISGTIELLTALNEEYRAAINFTRIDTNGGRTLAQFRSGLVCSLVNDARNLTVSPAVSGCPVPGGNYKVEAYRFDNSWFTYFDKGSYEVQLELLREDERLCGLTIEMTLA